MMRALFISFLLLCLISPSLLGQSSSDREALEIAKEHVEKLTSDEFAGRGYLHDGHLKAANYIASQFKTAGLLPLGTEDFFQAFQIEINLAKKASLKINGKTMEIGEQVIVNRFSGSGTVEGKIVDMGYGLEPSEKVTGKIALIRDGWPKKLANDSKKREPYKDLSQLPQRIGALLTHSPSAILVLKEKLTAGFTRQSAPLPILEIRKLDWPKRAKTALLEVESGIESITSQNVIGYLPGTEVNDTAIIISAHYDHLGQLEDAVFTGANDNASGVSMLLTMLKPLKYKTIFIAFGGEETGLIGSRYYVQNDPRFPLDQTKFILNLDLMGNGDKGIVAVGGIDYPDEFAQLQAANDELNAVPRVRSRKNAPNSDHFFFLKNGVPGFFVYTLGGPPHYHDVFDTAENLPFSRFEEVRELLLHFLHQF